MKGWISVMYIKSINIKNFKAIEDITINFKPGVNLLLGDNGIGKTSVIDAIVVALGGYFSGITGVKAKGILQGDVRIVSNDLTSVSKAIRYMTPTDINTVITIDNTDMTCDRSRKDQTGDTKTTTLAKELKSYAKKITNNPNSILPILSNQSIFRGTQFKRGDFGSKSKIILNDRRCGYIGCLDDKLDINEVKQWCLDMEMEAFNEEKIITEYENFKKIIGRFMQCMNEMDTPPKIFFNKRLKDIFYVENGHSLPISYLSAGYQALLFMIMDIAYRLAILNPNVSDFSEIPGIIMIDEIDAHLHPKWQWNVIGALETVLPNVQFIIATHSPIVISSCKNEHLIMLDHEKKVTYLSNAYAYSIQDVVEYRQGSLGIPQELRSLCNQFYEAYNNDDIDRAEKIYHTMSENFGEDNTEVKNARWELDMKVEDI